MARLKKTVVKKDTKPKAKKAAKVKGKAKEKKK